MGDPIPLGSWWHLGQQAGSAHCTPQPAPLRTSREGSLGARRWSSTSSALLTNPHPCEVTGRESGGWGVGAGGRPDLPKVALKKRKLVKCRSASPHARGCLPHSSGTTRGKHPTPPPPHPQPLTWL